MTRRHAGIRPSPGPQNLLAAISWALLVTVMFGGYALLRMLNSGHGLTDHEEQFFRAGHGHAGVLAGVGILYSSYLGRTLLSARAQIVAWVTYAIGVFGLSGGMFLHMLVGEPGKESAGTTVIALGGLVLVAAVLFLAWQLYVARHVVWSVSEREQERSNG